LHKRSTFHFVKCSTACAIDRLVRLSVVPVRYFSQSTLYRVFPDHFIKNPETCKQAPGPKSGTWSCIKLKERRISHSPLARSITHTVLGITVARFKIGHTPRKLPDLLSATFRFIAYHLCISFKIHCAVTQVLLYTTFTYFARVLEKFIRIFSVEILLCKSHYFMHFIQSIKAPFSLTNLMHYYNSILHPNVFFSN